MSRGFIKEGDQEEIPRVPMRAYLPEGAPNYVTKEGLDALKEELKNLEAERVKTFFCDIVRHSFRQVCPHRHPRNLFLVAFFYEAPTHLSNCSKQKNNTIGHEILRAISCKQ